MPRIQVSMTKQFYDAVETYAKKRGLKSLSAALVELASVGYESLEGGRITAINSWGGDRQSEKYQQYREWLNKVTAGFNDYDPAADQDGDYSYAAWLAKQNQE